MMAAKGGCIDFMFLAPLPGGWIRYCVDREMCGQRVWTGDCGWGRGGGSVDRGVYIPPPSTPEIATDLVGTHPTGIHSC